MAEPSENRTTGRAAQRGPILVVVGTTGLVALLAVALAVWSLIHPPSRPSATSGQTAGEPAGPKSAQAEAKSSPESSPDKASAPPKKPKKRKKTKSASESAGKTGEASPSKKKDGAAGKPKGKGDGEKAADGGKADKAKGKKSSKSSWKPLDLKLPEPAFESLPSRPHPGTTVKVDRQPRGPVRVPPDVENCAKGRSVTGSSRETVLGQLAAVTDGDKRADRYVAAGSGIQWVQVHLGRPCKIYAIVVWHRHDRPLVYHDVIVRLAADGDFKQGVRTVFNNDRNGSAGLGEGGDREYFETHRGKVIPVDGRTARYVRLYANGWTDSEGSGTQNHYTEVQVWGLPQGEGSSDASA